MSFPFGSRASFRDRTGMSGDEILDDMLKNIKQRKKEFFESPPKWRSMGVFDDDQGSAGGSRVKAHLGNLAARHPELADHLLDLLPEETTTGSPHNKGKQKIKKNTSRNSSAKEGTTHPQTATTGTQTGGLESDIKLRSTVPDMQSSAGESVTDAERGQRSQSAPPQAAVPNRPQQQKDESGRHIPIRTDSPSGIHHPGPQMPRQPNLNFQKPPTPSHFPSQQFYQQAPQSQHFPDESSGKGPTVRHIPIFVEGRDEPLLPKDAGQATKRGGCQGKTDHQTASEKKQQPEQQNHDQGGQQQQQQYQPQHQHPQQQQQQQHHHNQQQQHHQQQSQPAQPPTPPLHHPQKPDPLAQVAEVVKEVEALAVKVNEWNGTTRTDKEYIYLDEMLTRNLLKLDNIETEGKDEVRTARKDAIRRIQAAISVLESKTEKAAQNKQQNHEEGLKSGDENKEPKLDEKPSESQSSEPTQNECTSSATQT